MGIAARLKVVTPSFALFLFVGRSQQSVVVVSSRQLSPASRKSARLTFIVERTKLNTVNEDNCAISSEDSRHNRNL
ncbi:hypothetical protein SDJN03_06365, partial [Cucurbita argyrosperma subsp. sororia]